MRTFTQHIVRAPYTIAVLIMLHSISAHSAVKRTPSKTVASSAPTFQGTKPAEEKQLEQSDFSQSKRDIESELYLKDANASRPADVRSAELEKMIAEREKLRDMRRVQAIKLLESFVAANPETAPEMPDALLRLGEMVWEDIREQHLKLMAAWQRLPDEKRSKEPPKPNFQKPIAIYDRILTKHRDFSRYDLTLYLKAFALIETGKTDEALALYTRILTEFPESRFVPDAHMAHAEAELVNHSNFNAALARYEQVLRYTDSDLYPLALFKSAWCLWRLNRSQEAAVRFRMVLDIGQGKSKTASAKTAQGLRELREEALASIIELFTEDENNTAADLQRFLAEIGGEKYAQEVLERVSDTFYNQSRYERSLEAYQFLLKGYPYSAQAPLFQARLADSYARVGDTKGETAALLALAQMTAKDSEWSKRQYDPEAIKKGQNLAEQTLRQAAMSSHQRGQQYNERAALEQAEARYGVYLKYFPKTTHSYTIRFYRAELLFHRLQRYAEAGDAYMDVVKANPKGKHTRDSLYNAIASYERVREREVQGCLKGAQAKSAKISCAETDNDRKFSAAIEQYIALYPTDPDIPEILFRQGKFYYDRGIYDSSVRLFGQLLEKYPSSSYSAEAGELILESFNKAQDYGNIRDWARKLKRTPAFADAKSQAKLNGLILQASFKIGEQLASQDKHTEAAQAYYQAAEEFGKDPRAPQAYYNAGLEYQRAGDLGAAARAYERLMVRYPGNITAAQGAWTGAKMYESVALFSDAARFYGLYAEKFPKESKRPDALYNAVLLRLTSGEYDKAIAGGQIFLKLYPKHQLNAEVTFLIGQAYEDQKKWSQAASVYRSFVGRARNLDQATEANARLAKVLIQSKQQSAAEQVLREGINRAEHNRGQLHDSGRYYLAELQMLQGDLLLQEYEAIRIEGSGQALTKRLNQKSDFLKKASLAYAEVVKVKVPEWATAALFKIGRSYELFAESLRQAPVPTGLSPDEQQSYREQLETFVIPIEDKALEAYEGGYRKALELQIYNDWTRELREGLTRLSEVSYPPLRETGIQVSVQSAVAEPALIDAIDRGAKPKAAAVATTKGATP